MAERADAVVLWASVYRPTSKASRGDAGNLRGGRRQGRSAPDGSAKRVALKTVVAAGKPTVLVLVSGSPLDLTWAHDRVGAIVQAFYPGEQGGAAIADVLFGEYNPGGRLPVTFPRSVDDLPPIADYRMTGRTYRYSEREPLYPFGYGLSYTTFRYSDVVLSKTPVAAGDSVQVSAVVENTGSRSGDEVVQLYVEDVESSCVVPRRDLRAFERIALGPGQSRRVVFPLSARDLSMIDGHGRRVLEPGLFRLSIGGSQPDARSAALTGARPLVAEIEVVGDRLELAY